MTLQYNALCISMKVAQKVKDESMQREVGYSSKKCGCQVNNLQSVDINNPSIPPGVANTGICLNNAHDYRAFLLIQQLTC